MVRPMLRGGKSNILGRVLGVEIPAQATCDGRVPIRSFQFDERHDDCGAERGQCE